MKNNYLSKESNLKKIFRVKSNVTNQETRLVRVLTKDKNQAKNTITNGVVLCLQKIKCEPSKQQPKVVQCFKCQAHGHIAANCDNIKDAQNAVDTTTSKTATKINLAAQTAMKCIALPIKAAKSIKKQN